MMAVTPDLPGLPRPASFDARSDKRWNAFRAFALDGGNGGAGDVDELEMRAGQPALRRAKGGIAVDPTKLSHKRTRSALASLHAGNDSFRGPHTDIMGPDMGTNEQIMAWFMDTYSVYQGYSVSEIVTWQTSVDWRHRRPARVDRPRRRLSRRTCHDMLKMDPEKSTAIIQGFGNVGSVAALALALKTGVKVVGISDATVALYNPQGIDVKARSNTSLRRAIFVRSIKVIGSTRTRC